MAKRLYRKKSEQLNGSGERLYREVSAVILPILAKWFSEGYSVRDMQSLIMSIVFADLARKALQRSLTHTKN